MPLGQSENFPGISGQWFCGGLGAWDTTQNLAEGVVNEGHGRPGGWLGWANCATLPDFADTTSKEARSFVGACLAG